MTTNIFRPENGSTCSVSNDLPRRKTDNSRLLTTFSVFICLNALALPYAFCDDLTNKTNGQGNTAVEVAGHFPIDIRQTETDYINCLEKHSLESLTASIEPLVFGYMDALSTILQKQLAVSPGSDLTVTSIQPMPVCQTDYDERFGEQVFLKQRFLISYANGKRDLVSVDNKSTYLNFIPGTRPGTRDFIEALDGAVREISCHLGIDLPLSEITKSHVSELVGFAKELSLDVCSDEPTNPKVREIVSELIKSGMRTKTDSEIRSTNYCRNQRTPALIVEKHFTDDCIYEPKFTVRFPNSSGMIQEEHIPGSSWQKPVNDVNLMLAVLQGKSIKGTKLPNLVPHSMFIQHVAEWARHTFPSVDKLQIQIVSPAFIYADEPTLDISIKAPKESELKKFDVETFRISENDLREFVRIFDHSRMNPGSLNYLIVAAPGGVDEFSLGNMLRNKFSWNFQVWRYDKEPQAIFNKSDWDRLQIDEQGRIDLSDVISKCRFGIDFQINMPGHDNLFWPIEEENISVCTQHDCQTEPAEDRFSMYKLFRIGYQEITHRKTGKTIVTRLNKNPDSRWTFRNRSFRSSCQDLVVNFEKSEAYLMFGKKPLTGAMAEIFFKPSLENLKVQSVIFKNQGVLRNLLSQDESPIFRHALLKEEIQEITVALNQDVLSLGSEVDITCSISFNTPSGYSNFDLLTSTNKGTRAFSIIPALETLENDSIEHLKESDWQLRCTIKDRNSDDTLPLLDHQINRNLKVDYRLAFLTEDPDKPGFSQTKITQDCDSAQKLIGAQTDHPTIFADAGFPMTLDLWRLTGCSNTRLKIAVQTAYDTRNFEIPLLMKGDSESQNPNIWTPELIPLDLLNSLKRTPQTEPRISLIEVLQDGCAEHVKQNRRICSNSSMKLPPNQIGVVLFRYDSADITTVGDDSLDFTASDAGIGIALRRIGRGATTPVQLFITGGASQYAESESVNRTLAWNRSARTLSRFLATSLYQMAAPGSVTCEWSDGNEISKSGGASAFINSIEKIALPRFRNCVRSNDLQEPSTIKRCFNESIKAILSNLNCIEAGTKLSFTLDSGKTSSVVVEGANIEIPSGRLNAVGDNAHRAQNAAICVQIGNRRAGYCEDLPASKASQNEGQ